MLIRKLRIIINLLEKLNMLRKVLKRERNGRKDE